MAFTFLHTADWHIAKPFGRFAEDRSAILRRARLTAIDRLAAAARSGGACHVLIGGDTYDQPGLSDKEMREPIARLAVHPDLIWHIIPGNHDPAMPGGVWDRVRRDGLPGNVRLYLEAQPVELGERCWLLPAPLGAKAMTGDPTAWMDGAATPAGAIRIGLAHGSTRGFGSEQTASVTISPTRANAAGLAYLALGDWHGTREAGPRAWYSGTPEPDGYLDNEPGNALLVHIEGPQHANVERVSTAAHRWLRRSIDLARLTDLDQLEDEIGRLGATAGQMLLVIDLAGRISLDEERRIARRLDLIEPRLLHLERNQERVILAAAETDVAALGDGTLGSIAMDLSRLAADAADPESRTAQRALKRLVALAADAVEAAA